MKITSSLSLIIFIIQVFLSEQKLKTVLSYTDDSLVNEAMKQILKLKKEYNTLLISVRHTNPSLQWLEEVQENSSIILSKNTIEPFDRLEYSDNTRKIDAMIVFMRTLKNFKTTLHKLQRIILKNVMIPVYIVSERKNNSCEIATSVLQTIWNYGILTSYFLCSHPKTIIKIYTYNPFTDRAPNPWNQVHKFENSNWTIYERQYIKGQGLNEFDFDRTKYLDGHQVTIACRAAPNATFFSGRFFDQKTFLENEGSFYPDSLRFIDSLSLALNISFRIYIYHDRWYNQKYIESLDNFEKDVFKNSSAKILLIPRQIYKERVFKTLYPIQASHFGIVTYHKGYQTLVEKIYGFYGTWTLLNTIIFLLIIFIFIWFNEKRNIAFAVFEILRLIINNSLQTPMNSLSRRIFFGTVLLYFLIIQATFNGHLAKFLTKPQLRKQIDTLDDLEEFGYGSLEDEFFRELITRMSPEERNNDETCVRGVLNNECDFCVGDYITLYHDANRKSNLYICKNPFGIIYWLYSVRENWSLIDRFNKGLIRLWDMGFRNKWELIKITWFIHNDTVAEERKRNDYQPITLENLDLIFIFFVFGVSVSILSFVVELYVGRNFKRCGKKY